MPIPWRRRGALAALVLTFAPVAACSSGGGASGGASGFCSRLAAASATPTGVTDAASARKAYKKLVDDYQALVATAPADIRDDLKVVADQAKQSYDLLEKNGFDFEKTAADPGFAAVSAAASDPAKAAAGDRVAAYAKTSCGLDLRPTTTTG